VHLERLTRGRPDGKSTLSFLGSNLATLSGPTTTPGRSLKLAPWNRTGQIEGNVLSKMKSEYVSVLANLFLGNLQHP
jgi:hypothetical protein